MIGRLAVLFTAMMLQVFGAFTTEAGEVLSRSRVGVLIPESGRPETQSVKGLRDGLRELGYKERENMILELRDARGDRAALKPLANELVSQKVDVIFTTGTRATEVAIQATTDIPIVFRYPGNPQTMGLVKTNTPLNPFSRPEHNTALLDDRAGKNITGVAGFGLEMTGQRLEKLRQIIPRVRRVHIFYDLNDRFSRDNFALTKKLAEKLGLEVAEHGTKSAEELRTSLDNLQSGADDVLFQIPDNLVSSEADFIFKTARRKKLATMFNEEVWAIKGALSAYGPSNYQMGRQAAGLIAKILKGEKPENLPVEPARKYDLIINFRTATAIGLTVPPDVLKKADKIIR